MYNYSQAEQKRSSLPVVAVRHFTVIQTKLIIGFSIFQLQIIRLDNPHGSPVPRPLGGITPCLFFQVDICKRLQDLFWCDAQMIESQTTVHPLENLTEITTSLHVTQLKRQWYAGHFTLLRPPSGTPLLAVSCSNCWFWQFILL